MTRFEPRYPEWDARTRASFADQRIMQTMGVRVAGLAPGEVTLEMPFAEAFTQQHGFLHAGAITTVADTACGFAAMTLMPEDGEVLTVEFKVSLMAPARGELFRFAGRVIRPGRTLTFTEGRIDAVSGGEAHQIAGISATMMCVVDRPDVRPAPASKR